MSLTVSGEVPIGALAEISNRSESSQGGPPKIVSGSTLYAVLIRSITVA